MVQSMAEMVFPQYIACFMLLLAIIPALDGYSDAEVNEYMEYAVADYKLQLHRATQTRPKRVRRDMTTEDFNTQTKRTAQMSDIRNITPWQSIPTSYPVELEPFIINNDNYMAVVNFKSKDGEYRTESAVYIMNGTEFRLLQNFSTSGGIDFEFADLGREQYAIFLDHVGQNWYGGTDKYTYMKSFQVNQFLPSEGKDKPFQYRTKVRALGAKKVKVFTKDNKHYFVTANSYHKMGNLYHVKSTMHVQTAYGYELVQEFITQGAQDVEVEVINGRRFIFFANKMDNAGNVDIYSIIYSENQGSRGSNRRPFGLYQRLETHAARDFEYFTFDGNHYLAVANEFTQVKSMDASTGRPVVFNDYHVDSVIYWWTGTMFVQWQLIPTHGAVKWSYFPSSFGDPMLVVANTKSPPMIYTYDPLRGIFVPTQIQDISPFPGQTDLIADVRSVMPFTTKDNGVFLAVANYDPQYASGYNIFKLTFEMRPVPELERSIPEVIRAHLIKMTIELRNIKLILMSLLEEVTNKVMTKSTAQNITSSVHMKNVSITGTLTTTNLFYRNKVTFGSMKTEQEKVEELARVLDEQEEQIKLLESKYDDAVLLNQNTTITGKKVFTEHVHVYGDVVSNGLNVSGLIDGTKLADLFTQTLRKSKDQDVHGNYSFTENITIVDGEVKELNTMEVDSFMTTNTEQVITGIKTFNETVTINQVVMENFTVNHLRIPEDIVTVNGNRTITGRKMFNLVEMKNLEIDGLLNDVNITHFNRNKMTLTTDQDVSSVVFGDGFGSNSAITVGGTVDGVNLTAIGVNMSGKVETVPGPKTFKSIVVKGSVVAYRMNGFDLNKAVTLNTTQVISAKLTFVSPVNVTGNIVTNSTINDLRLSEQVVTIYGNQTIGGHKTITNHTTVLKNINTEGKVDGVDLRAWNESAVRKNAKKPVTGVKRFVSGAKVSDQLRVNTINNVTLSSLREDKVSIKENGTRWTNRFNFETLKVDNLLFVGGTLNGFEVPEDFVPLNVDGNISGVKTFTNSTNVRGNVSVEGNLSGKNFTSFYQNVLKNNTNETIDGDLYFSQPLVVDSLNVSGKINNLSIPEDVFTTNTYQNISTTFYFTADTTFENSITVNTIFVNDTVNDIDVYKMEQDAIHKDKNQTINGTVIFVGGIDCKQNLSVAGLINGVNLTELMDGTVRVSRAQNISGYKTFQQDVMFEAPLVSPGTINGVNISDLNSTTLKTDGEQTIYSVVDINGAVNVTNSMDTSGTRINGVDFTDFITNAAKTGVPNTVNGSITYTNGATLNTLWTEAVDGVNVSEILLTRFNQSVTGYLNFTSVSVGNMSISGLMDGVDIELLRSKSLKLHGYQNVTRKYVFRDVKVDGNASIAGKINDVNLVDFDSSAMHLSGNETVTGKKHFRNVTFGKVTFGLLNNANVTMLFGDALRKSGVQKVCRRTTFLNSISISSNATVNDILIRRSVNDVDVSNLFTKAVKVNGNKTLRGKYYFESGIDIVGNMTVEGKLNNVSIPGDFMTTLGNQVITGNKTFNSSEFGGHLNVTGLIDGVNLTHVHRNRVTLTGDQRLPNLHFNSVVLEGELRLPNESTINHIDISKGLVPLNKASTIHGNKTFNSTYIRGDLSVATGNVNGVNLKKLATDTVKVSSPTTQNISADQRFLENVNIIGNLTVGGLINRVKVNDVRNYSADISDTIKTELQQLSWNAESLCNATTALIPIAVTEHVLTGIEKIDVFQSFPVDGNLGSVHSTTIGNDVFISIARALGAICGPAYILKCNQAMECGIHLTIYTNAPKMEFFDYETFDALLVSHWKAGVNDTLGCKTDPEIYVYNRDYGRYMPYQTLNKVLFESDLAPVITSSTILAPYLGRSYAQYQRSSSSSSDFESLLPVDIKWFERAGKNYLVVGGYDQNTNFVDILYIEGKDLASLKIEQRIKANGRHVSIGKLNNGQLIIATSSDGPQGSIQLYIFNGKTQRFEFYQRLHHSASTVKLRKIQDKQYLLYASPANGFGLCEWLGVSGYGACVTLEITDTTSVETVITSSGAYAITGTDTSLMIYRTLFKGNNKLYGQPVC